MITSFEVGAVFKIINEASPALRTILEQVRKINLSIDNAKKNMSTIGGGAVKGSPALRTILKQVSDLNLAIDKARENLKTLGTSTMPVGLTTAVTEAKGLAAAWGDVAKNATTARAAMIGASRGGGGGALPPPSVGGAGIPTFAARRRSYIVGGGGGGGGGGAHIEGPSVPIPGGSHLRVGGALAVAAGVLGYAGLQAANYEDTTAMMAQHAGVDYTANRQKFEGILKDATKLTGYNEHDVSEATQDVLRQFKYTGGSNGINVLPDVLAYGATESRLKGTGLKESESAMVGAAHMLRKYAEADVKKLLPAFSVLSVANPMSLAAMDRAFGYAVPLLQSGMDLDPFKVMASSTALARAGIKSTKAGTWIRQMMIGSMPGTSLMTKMMFKKHNSALKELGLVDDKNKPTWFENGKPDEMSFLRKVSQNLPKIDITRRIAILKALAGSQGAGALAVLAEPAVGDQMGKLYAATQDPAEINRIRNFQTVYAEQSTKQNARQTLQTFNVTMADLGDKILPAANKMLSDFKSTLEGISRLIPGGKGSGALVGARVGEGIGAGALAGGIYGVVGGPFGALIGAGIGGIAGGVEGVAESYMKSHNDQLKLGIDSFGVDKGGSYTSPGKTGKPAEKIVVTPPINLSLNVDGQMLAQVMSNKTGALYQYETGAPASNGADRYGP